LKSPLIYMLHALTFNVQYSASKLLPYSTYATAMPDLRSTAERELIKKNDVRTATTCLSGVKTIIVFNGH
jgi:hypothetical protein